MPFTPMHVAQAARDQHARKVALKSGRMQSESYNMMYTSTSWMREADARFGERADDSLVPKGSYASVQRTRELERIQGLGDDEPISHSSFNSVHFTPQDIAAHGRMGVYDRMEPPAPFNKLLSRRMAEGRMWPSLLGTPDAQIENGAGTGRGALRFLTHPSNMSPSEQRFSTEVEYWLRRNMRAMTPHIADHFDFAEFVIERVFVSKRCRHLYILWSTVGASARLRIEPLLPQLSPWVIRTIKRRIRNQPSIPKIHWVYDNGATPTELPNKLKQQLKAVHAHTATTIDQRVDYLRQLDSVQARLKGVPWFMPYLWGKNNKAEKTAQLQRDYAAVKEMNNKSNAFANGNSGHVA